jgi:hypothetical protein
MVEGWQGRVVRVRVCESSCQTASARTPFPWEAPFLDVFNRLRTNIPR